VIASDDVSGPVNAVAPEPVTNKSFTKTLGRVLGRPTIFPLPGFVVKTLFGEMGEALLLSGQRVLPAGLTSHGYAFRYSNLEAALKHVLGSD
jgi:NAD dependent epimerase/dehydratase family enzyme